MAAAFLEDFPAVTSPVDRIFCHVDLDAFYTQVEAVRLDAEFAGSGGFDRQTPLAVAQWFGLIAVNYPARAAGVRKTDGTMMSISGAKKACPNLTVVHVETLDENNVVSRGGRQDSHKSSLRPYRRASTNIFRVLVSILGAANVEKAGIDETYLDLTELASALLETGEIRQADGVIIKGFLGIPCVADGATRADVSTAACVAVTAQVLRGRWYVIAPGSGGGNSELPRAIPDDVVSSAKSALAADPSGTASAAEDAAAVNANTCPWPWSERELLSWFGGSSPLSADPSSIHLAAGAVVAAWVRHRIWVTERYTCSAGVAATKVLAKLGSGRNKPNRQTIVMPAAAAEFMAATRISKVGSLGGIFGERLIEYLTRRSGNSAAAADSGNADGILVSDAQKLSVTEICNAVCHGNRADALSVYRLLRGVGSHEAIAPRQAVSSMGSSVSVSSPPIDRVVKWLRGAIAGELAQRAEEEMEERARRPTKLVFHWTVAGESHRSKRTSLPSSGVLTREVIGNTGEKLLRKLCEEHRVFPPLINLGLALADFIDVAQSAGKMTSFFAPAAASGPQASTGGGDPVVNVRKRLRDSHETGNHVIVADRIDSDMPPVPETAAVPACSAAEDESNESVLPRVPPASVSASGRRHLDVRDMLLNRALNPTIRPARSRADLPSAVAPEVIDLLSSDDEECSGDRLIEAAKGEALGYTCPSCSATVPLAPGEVMRVEGSRAFREHVETCVGGSGTANAKAVTLTTGSRGGSAMPRQRAVDEYLVQQLAQNRNA